MNKHTKPSRLRVFLCHGSEDKASIRKLFLDLREDGAEPWLDEKNILPGEDWDNEIRKAVKASHVILVCLSTASVNKEGYLQKEIRFALDVADEKPEGTIFIIPVRLDECELPSRLQKWEWVDGIGSEGYSLIIRALRRRAESLEIDILPGDGFGERADRPLEVATGKVLYKSRNIRELLRKFKGGELRFEDVKPVPSDFVVGITAEGMEEALAPFEGEERRRKERETILRLAGIISPYREWIPKNVKELCFANNSDEGEIEMEFEMISVQSSNVASIGYSHTQQTLRVAFNSGSVYEYYGVPEDLFDGLLAADSKGKFLNENIKMPGFHYRQVV